MSVVYGGCYYFYNYQAFAHIWEAYYKNPKDPYKYHLTATYYSAAAFKKYFKFLTAML